MNHVNRMYKAAMGQSSQPDSGTRASMVQEVETLVKLFHTELGPDLQTPTTHNPFFHTGVRRLFDPSAMKECRPFEWVWRVADGRSRGKDMARPESWAAMLRRHVREHMFCQ